MKSQKESNIDRVAGVIATIGLAVLFFAEGLTSTIGLFPPSIDTTGAHASLQRSPGSEKAKTAPNPSPPHLGSDESLTSEKKSSSTVKHGKIENDQSLLTVDTALQNDFAETENHELAIEVSPEQLYFGDENSHLTVQIRYALESTSDVTLPLSEAVSENIQYLEVHLSPQSNEPQDVEVSLVAISVPGIAPQHSLKSWTTRLFSDKKRTLVYKKGKDILLPGLYELKVSRRISGHESGKASLPFRLLSDYPFTTIRDDAASSGVNVALDVLGGRIESVSSELSPHPAWSRAFLNDGFAKIVSSGDHVVSHGWMSDEKTPPHEITLSFHQGRRANVSKVVLHTEDIEGAFRNRKQTIPRSTLPRHVKILIQDDSLEENDKQYRLVAQAQLLPVVGAHVVTFPPHLCARLKILIEDNYGSTRTTLSEIEVIEEKDLRESVVSGRSINLLHPALGGKVIVSSFPERSQSTYELVDGIVNPQSGWSSGRRSPGEKTLFPLSFVFGFRNNGVASIKSAIITSLSKPRFSGGSAIENHWPKEVAVRTSNSLRNNFKEVARFTLQPIAEPQEFPLHTSARYLEFVILDNFGAQSVSIGEIELIESSEQSSILDTKPSTHEDLPQRETKDTKEYSRSWISPEAALETPTIDEERVINLGDTVDGRLDSSVDRDRFSFTIPGESPRFTTISFHEEPSQRGTLLLKRKSGEEIVRLSPKSNTNSRTTTVELHPGDYSLSIFEEPLSTLLIWDMSGSMAGRSSAVERAVKHYVESLPPDELLNLIEFSDKAEVLLPQFTADRAQLMQALHKRFRPLDSTALYDALLKGIMLLETQPGAKSLILLSDGIDTTSKSPLFELWDRLKVSDISFSSIGLGQDLRSYYQSLAASGDTILQAATELKAGYFTRDLDGTGLSTIYDKIRAELRRPSTYRVTLSSSERRGALQLIQGNEQLTAVTAPPRIEVVFDASGSMKEKQGEGTRMKVAQTVLSEILGLLPENVEVGLRVFGHRIREGRPGDCRDSELLIPFGGESKESLHKAIQALKPLGTTALAYSLENVAEDLRGLPGKSLVLLVTDGEEECNGDPLAALRKIQAQGISITLQIVGFALQDAHLKQQLEYLAQKGGGHFFNASDETALRDAVTQSLTVPFQVVFPHNQQTLATGTIGGPALDLPSGVYDVLVESAQGSFSTRHVVIEPEKVSKVYVQKEGEQIALMQDQPQTRTATTISQKELP